MKDITIAFIYSLKQNPNKKESLEEIAIDFISKITGSDKNVYKDPKILNDVLRKFFEEFLDAGYLISKLKEYSEIKRYILSLEKYNNVKNIVYEIDNHSILSTMELCQVRDNKGNYINGFKELKISNVVPDYLDD